MRTDIVFEASGLWVSAQDAQGEETPIVKGVSFQVPRGKVVALIGESGSGKTTLALSALGYCKPGLAFSKGQAILNGQDLIAQPLEHLRRIRGRSVAYLAQSAAATFNPSMTINAQVIETVLLRGTKTKEQALARAIELYRALELPEPARIGERYPHQVSGGQLQRLMAAMALCSDPELLVLDEPTTALDVTTQIEVLKVFKKVIQDQGASAIYVTHDLALVAQIADYVVVLYQGEVQERGPVVQVIARAKHPYTQKLLAASRRMPTTGDLAPKVDAGSDAPQRQGEAPVIEMRGVSAEYRSGNWGIGAANAPVLSDIDLSIAPGRTVGIIGESGSGKSTLARVIAGLLPPVRGDVLLNGEAAPKLYSKRSRQSLQQVQFVYQMADTALNPRQKIGQILRRPLEFYRGLKGSAARERVDALLQQVELSPAFAHRFPHELSGGQKQRVNLARALAAGPRLILCDEVTSALDSIVGANIIALLNRLKQDLGLSFLFISHDLSTVSHFADRVVVLYAGRIVEQGSISEVLAPPYHPYTQLLIASTPELEVGWLERVGQTTDGTEGGDVDTPYQGCAFFNRCPLAMKGTCDTVRPPMRSRPDASGHVIECHLEPGWGMS